jgi:hypothetical protein
MGRVEGHIADRVSGIASGFEEAGGDFRAPGIGKLPGTDIGAGFGESLIEGIRNTAPPVHHRSENIEENSFDHGIHSCRIMGCLRVECMSEVVPSN